MHDLALMFLNFLEFPTSIIFKPRKTRKLLYLFRTAALSPSSILTIWYNTLEITRFCTCACPAFYSKVSVATAVPAHHHNTDVSLAEGDFLQL